MKSGKYDDITLEQYHNMEGWSKSSLDKIDKSPAHYLESKQNPKEQTAAMAFGSALHCAVLTPELYESEYCIALKCDRRTKDGKAAWQQFVDESAGKVVIEAESAGKVELMKKAIFSHPLASSLLKNGEAEQSFFWTDPRTGLLCKCRPDYLRNDKICIDLKTASSAEYFDFQRSAYNFRYHVQGAFFIDGIFHATGMLCGEFVLIVIETEPPFGIMVFILDEDAIKTGRVTYQQDLDTIVDWQEHPEFYESVYKQSLNPIELSLPPWAN